MSKELDDLTAEVQAEETVEAGVVTLLDGIATRLAEAGTDPAALASLTSSIKASSDALAAAAAAVNPAPAPSPNQAAGASQQAQTQGSPVDPNAAQS